MVEVKDLFLFGQQDGILDGMLIAAAQKRSLKIHYFTTQTKHSKIPPISNINFPFIFYTTVPVGNISPEHLEKVNQTRNSIFCTKIENYIPNCTQLNIKKILLNNNEDHDIDDIISQLGGFPLLISLPNTDMATGKLFIGNKALLKFWIKTIKKDNVSGNVHIMPYIKHKKHIRVYVIDNKIIPYWQENQITSDSFASNLENYGNNRISHKGNLPNELSTALKTKLTHSHIEFGGIDLIQTTDDQVYILEVNYPANFAFLMNHQPQANIPEKIIDLLIKKNHRHQQITVTKNIVSDTEHQLGKMIAHYSGVSFNKSLQHFQKSEKKHNQIILNVFRAYAPAITISKTLQQQLNCRLLTPILINKPAPLQNIADQLQFNNNVSYALSFPEKKEKNGVTINDFNEFIGAYYHFVVRRKTAILLFPEIHLGHSISIHAALVTPTQVMAQLLIEYQSHNNKFIDNELEIHSIKKYAEDSIIQNRITEICKQSNHPILEIHYYIDMEKQIVFTTITSGLWLNKFRIANPNICEQVIVSQDSSPAIPKVINRQQE